MTNKATGNTIYRILFPNLCILIDIVGVRIYTGVLETLKAWKQTRPLTTKTPKTQSFQEEEETNQRVQVHSTSSLLCFFLFFRNSPIVRGSKRIFRFVGCKFGPDSFYFIMKSGGSRTFQCAFYMIVDQKAYPTGWSSWAFYV